MPGSSWQRWNWLDAALLPLTGAAMRAAWIAPLLDALLRRATAEAQAGGAGRLVLAFLVGGSFAAGLARRSQRGRWIVVAGGLLAVFIAEWWAVYRGLYSAWDVRWPVALIYDLTRLEGFLLPLGTLAVASLLWWRGVTADWTSHAELTRSFVAGVVALGLGLASFPAWSPRTAAELPKAILIFLASAGAGLSLAEVSEASRTAGREAHVIRVNRYWLAAVVAVVAGIFGVGLIVAGVVTPQTVAAVLTGLRPVWEGIAPAALGLFMALLYATFFLLSPLIWLLRLLAAKNTSQPLRPPRPLTELTPDGSGRPAMLPPPVEWALRGVFVAGLLIALGLLFAWALRRYYARDEEGVTESRELIWSWDLIRAQLAELTHRRRANPRPLFAPLIDGDLRSAIRAAYRRVLQLAVERGQPRRPEQTPTAYLPTLVALWPDAAKELRLLTEVYTATRYGPALPSQEQIELVRRGLERITAGAEGRAARPGRNSQAGGGQLCGPADRRAAASRPDPRGLGD